MNIKYFDHAATTQLKKEVLDEMMKRYVDMTHRFEISDGYA